MLDSSAIVCLGLSNLQTTVSRTTTEEATVPVFVVFLMRMECNKSTCYDLIMKTRPRSQISRGFRFSCKSSSL